MKIEIKKLGEEVICDAYVQSNALNNTESLKQMCLAALKKGDCHVVGDKILAYQFPKDDNMEQGCARHEGEGVTILIIIEESHFHISTWPEHNFIQINVNTCGHIAKPMIAIGYLLYELKVITSSLQVIERGVPLK